jgi:PBP1b-binding outer membrane lipoprotein LpoB
LKKYLFLCFFITITILFLTGCAKAEQGSSFKATVLESNDTNLLVEPEEGEQELRSADKIYISVGDETKLESQEGKIIIDDIKIGDQIEIFYDGGIAESYPAQIFGAYRIKLLE